MEMIKAILYDLDGVLVDATEWHYESLNEALREISRFEISRLEHLSTFNGLPTNTKLEMLYEQNRVRKEDFEAIWKLKQKKTNEIIEKTATIDETKQRLHEGTKTFKKICVTNSIRQTALLMLEKTCQLSFMDHVISNEDVNNPKPDPEGYLKAIQYLQLQPNECMIVEDAPKGIEAAKKSNAHVYEVKGYHDVTLENVLTRINRFNMDSK
jgi:HAD superfamily hydrolase (TIGR01509 family)